MKIEDNALLLPYFSLPRSPSRLDRIRTLRGRLAINRGLNRPVVAKWKSELAALTKGVQS